MKAESFNDVLVKQTDKGRGVFAARNFSLGETVVVGCRIKVLSARTIHSLQMNFNLHVELDEPARLLNHSCSPNTGVRNNQKGGYDFVALFDILEGNEITFDYETTEYFSIAVPKCLCGSLDCRGRTSGFHFLPLKIRKQYGEFIGNYLKSSTEFP